MNILLEGLPLSDKSIVAKYLNDNFKYEIKTYEDIYGDNKILEDEDFKNINSLNKTVFDEFYFKWIFNDLVRIINTNNTEFLIIKSSLLERMKQIEKTVNTENIVLFMFLPTEDEIRMKALYRGDKLISNYYDMVESYLFLFNNTIIKDKYIIKTEDEVQNIPYIVSSLKN